LRVSLTFTIPSVPLIFCIAQGWTLLPATPPPLFSTGEARLLAARCGRSSPVSDAVGAAYRWLGAAVVRTAIASPVSFAVEGATHRRLGAALMITVLASPVWGAVGYFEAA